MDIIQNILLKEVKEQGVVDIIMNMKNEMEMSNIHKKVMFEFKHKTIYTESNGDGDDSVLLRITNTGILLTTYNYLNGGFEGVADFDNIFTSTSYVKKTIGEALIIKEHMIFEKCIENICICYNLVIAPHFISMELGELIQENGYNSNYEYENEYTLELTNNDGGSLTD